MGLFDDIREQFDIIDDGTYVVRIEGFTRKQSENGSNPLLWELTLMEGVNGYLPEKQSDIETHTGFSSLMNELQSLGYKKPKRPEELETVIYQLQGELVEVEVKTNPFYSDDRFIRFVRKIK